MNGYFYVCCRRGCPRRSLDSGRIYNYLKLNGGEATEKVSRADLIVVYTCGGFQRTEEASLKTIRMMCAQKKRRAKLVVTGCLLKINPEAISGIGNPYLYILEHQELHKLDSIVHAEIPYRSVPDANIVPDVKNLVGRGSLLVALKKFLVEFQFNSVFIKRCLRFAKSKKNGIEDFSDDIYYLKIAHGCLGKCSYCAIKVATGTLKSKPIEKILREFEKGIAKGYKRFLLTAEDVGCYGLDIGSNIVRLLQKIYDVEKDFSLIINDFNVNWLIKFYDDLLPLFIKNKDKIEDIRLPIQSGSDKILKLMKRHYKIHDVKRVISNLKSNLPDLKIHTHILVGFPGETTFDFEQTRQLLQELDFAKVAIYSYEERSCTPAYHLPKKVPIDIRAQRASDLKAFNRSLDIN
jgi:tRNA A37 methylthiotransferase MiaB